MASLPVEIFNNAIAAYETAHEKAWAGAFVLVVIILVLSVAARYATRGRFRLVR